MLQKFLANRSGNFAMMVGLLMVPLTLAVGMAVDYSRYVSADAKLQELADGASLTLAASGEKDKDKLMVMAKNFLASHDWSGQMEIASVQSLASENDQIELKLAGRMDTTFMRLANIDTLDVRRILDVASCRHRKRRTGAGARQHLVDVGEGAGRQEQDRHAKVRGRCAR